MPDSISVQLAKEFNPETIRAQAEFIADQQAKFAKVERERDDAQRAIGILKEEYDRRVGIIDDQLRELRHQGRILQTFKDELEDSIVTINGERWSLFDLYESRRFVSRRCSSCHETDCEGCDLGSCV